MTLILASASPRRRELLSRAGVRFESLAADVDESPLPDEGPRAHAARLAEAKARAGRRLRPGAFVLGADTIVVLGDDILGKPDGAVQAAAMLAQLSDRSHVVMTATCLITPSDQVVARVMATEVSMRRIYPVEIDSYITSGEWRDKAGGYAAQGIAAAFITAIHGSYTNVVGLPLAEVIEDLRRTGAATPDYGNAPR